MERTMKAMRKIKKYILSAILTLGVLAVNAQQPGKVTRTWFTNPDVKIETPAFSGGHYYTSFKKMSKYLDAEQAQHPQLIKIETVGKTQRGRDIKLVTVSNGKTSDNKIKVLYTGCVHGNEHAGTEGLMWFIHQLANDNTVGKLLDNIDFYIMPMVNVDGSEADSRYTNNGTDPNRDQTRLSTPEVECMHSVATRVMPHIFVDFHEFKPLRTAYDDISDRIISNPNDFMFLYSSNPNVYPGLTEMIEGKFMPEAKKMAEKWGLTNRTYFTTKTQGDKTVMNVGGQSSRSSSNIMALRGSISLLMEIRGVGMGKTSYLRRVNTAYQLALSYANTASTNKADVLKVCAEALRQQRPIATEYKVPTTKGEPFEFIDLLRNEKVTINVDANHARELTVTKQVERPKAYVISAEASLAIDLVKKFGIRYEVIGAQKPAGNMSVEAYKVKSTRTQKAEVLGVHPLSVSVEYYNANIDMPKGSIIVPMDQPLATLAAILIEPECSNGFVNFRVIDAKEGQTLPIYRIKK